MDSNGSTDTHANVGLRLAYDSTTSISASPNGSASSSPGVRPSRRAHSRASRISSKVAQSQSNDRTQSNSMNENLFPKLTPISTPSYKTISLHIPSHLTGAYNNVASKYPTEPAAPLSRGRIGRKRSNAQQLLIPKKSRKCKSGANANSSSSSSSIENSYLSEYDIYWHNQWTLWQIRVQYILNEIRHKLRRHSIRLLSVGSPNSCSSIPRKFVTSKNESSLLYQSRRTISADSSPNRSNASQFPSVIRSLSTSFTYQETQSLPAISDPNPTNLPSVSTDIDSSTSSTLHTSNLPALPSPSLVGTSEWTLERLNLPLHHTQLTLPVIETLYSFLGLDVPPPKSLLPLYEAVASLMLIPLPSSPENLLPFHPYNFNYDNSMLPWKRPAHLINIEYQTNLHASPSHRLLAHVEPIRSTTSLFESSSLDSSPAVSTRRIIKKLKSETKKASIEIVPIESDAETFPPAPAPFTAADESPTPNLNDVAAVSKEEESQTFSNSQNQASPGDTTISTRLNKRKKKMNDHEKAVLKGLRNKITYNRVAVTFLKLKREILQRKAAKKSTVPPSLIISPSPNNAGVHSVGHLQTHDLQEEATSKISMNSQIAPFSIPSAPVTPMPPLTSTSPLPTSSQSSPIASLQLSTATLMATSSSSSASASPVALSDPKPKTSASSFPFYFNYGAPPAHPSLSLHPALLSQTKAIANSYHLDYNAVVSNPILFSSLISINQLSHYYSHPPYSPAGAPITVSVPTTSPKIKSTIQ